MTEQQVIHIAQVSGEAFDTSRLATNDFDACFETRPDGANFTEVTTKGHRDELSAAAKRHGYLLRGGIGDTAIALRGDHHLRAFRSVTAHSGGRDSFGAYGTRTLEVLTAEVYGEILTLIGGHWVRPRTAERRKKHGIMTALAVDLMQENSEGTKLAIGLGDLNERDVPGDAGAAATRFAAAGITTAWDELKYWPATGPGGGTIDFAATMDADTRLQAVGAFPWPLGNADHPRISFFFGARSLA